MTFEFVVGQLDHLSPFGQGIAELVDLSVFSSIRHGGSQESFQAVVYKPGESQKEKSLRGALCPLSASAFPGLLRHVPRVPVFDF
jgi:hypothetical protein